MEGSNKSSVMESVPAWSKEEALKEVARERKVEEEEKVTPPTSRT